MAKAMKAVKAGKCPVCGQHDFTTWDDICPICKWFHDPVQEEDPDEEECANRMSLNQAKAAYARGERVE